MHRVQWLWLLPLLLAAAGCAAGPGGSFDSQLDREVREGLARADQPWWASGERTGNVMLVVEKILLDRRDQVSLEAAWRYVDENVVAGGGALARQNGVRIGVAAGGFRAALQAALQKSSKQEVQKAMITALSGTTGTILVGQDTYVDVLRYRSPLGETVLLQRAFVGASLVVEPTILPEDKVRVRLYPRFTTRNGRTIDLTEMAVEVVVKHGQPLVIGGLDRSSDEVGAALFAWGRERQQRRVVLTVTPYIQGAP